MFPPLPPNIAGWHPLIVHFPIALLMVSPLFILLALFFNKHQKSLAASGLILMVLGTVGVFVAVFTGEKAGEYAASQGLISPECAQQQALPQHEHLAKRTRLLFSLLSAAQTLWLIIPLLLRLELTRRSWIIFQVVFLCVYMVCSLTLANTAHWGGRLVHEFGIQAPVSPPEPSPK